MIAFLDPSWRRSVGMRAAVLTAVFLTGCRGAAMTDAGTGASQRRKVPLSSVHFTGTQEGPQFARVPNDLAGSALRAFERSGPRQHVFLVRADTIDGAMAESTEVFAGRRSDREVTGEGQAGQIWLAAYLGSTRGSPPALYVGSVSVDPGRGSIRFAYRIDPRRYGTRDSYPYIAWVPLGELPAREYTLELFDATNKQTRLSREQAVR